MKRKQAKPRTQLMANLAQEREHVSKLISDATSFYNGWAVSEESVRRACDKAAAKIQRYLRARAEVRP